MGFAEILFFPFFAAATLAKIIIGIIILIFWIFMIVDCAKRKFRRDGEKILWILIMIFGAWIGAIVYFIVINQFNPKGIIK